MLQEASGQQGLEEKAHRSLLNFLGPQGGGLWGRTEKS